MLFFSKSRFGSLLRLRASELKQRIGPLRPIRAVLRVSCFIKGWLLQLFTDFHHCGYTQETQETVEALLEAERIASDPNVPAYDVEDALKLLKA